MLMYKGKGKNKKEIKVDRDQTEAMLALGYHFGEENDSDIEQNGVDPVVDNVGSTGEPIPPISANAGGDTKGEGAQEGTSEAQEATKGAEAKPAYFDAPKADSKAGKAADKKAK